MYMNNHKLKIITCLWGVIQEPLERIGAAFRRNSQLLDNVWKPRDLRSLSAHKLFRTTTATIGRRVSTCAQQQSEVDLFRCWSRNSSCAIAKRVEAPQSNLSGTHSLGQPAPTKPHCPLFFSPISLRRDGHGVAVVASERSKLRPSASWDRS